MEQNNRKFRLHLNLFDCIVILAALAVAGVLLWSRFRPAEAAALPAAQKMQYTICIQRAVEGTGALVQPGDELVDAVKNYDLGQVVSAQTMPATRSIIDEVNERYVTAEIPGYEDILIVVESTANVSGEKVLVGSGYELHVGEDIYVRGPGYLGSGEVYAMERGQ